MAELQKRPANYSFRASGEENFIPVGFTEEGGTVFTQSATSETEDIIEQQSSSAVSISGIVRSIALSAFQTSSRNLKMAFLDATVDGDTIYLGKKGTVIPQYYEMLVQFINPNEDGTFTAQYFRRTTPDGSISIDNSRLNYQKIPLNINILSDPDGIDGETNGVWAFPTSADPSDPNSVVIPSIGGIVSVPLDVQVTNPLEGAQTVAIAINPEAIFTASIRGITTLSLQTVAGVSVPTTSVYKSTISGVGQTGSTNTTFVHMGDSLPANACVGAKVKLVFSGAVNASEVRTVSAYNPTTKTFTVGTGAITSSLLGVSFDIQAGWVKTTPTAPLEISTSYYWIISGFIDEAGNKMLTGGRVRNFKTVGS